MEFMPVMEHPFYGSWGYQITGYFAPPAVMATPQDFMHLIDIRCTAKVLELFWIGCHPISLLISMACIILMELIFSSMPTREKASILTGKAIFSTMAAMKCALSSSAMPCFGWINIHVDGLRVDAVASMLYLDYSRNEGEWDPNEYGGRENLEAISFLKEFNEAVYTKFPDVHTIAEESTAWPMVSQAHLSWRPWFWHEMDDGMDA